MRLGVPTAREAADRNALYVRCLFHTFFYGPFANEEELVAALKTLDAADTRWDDDPFAIHFGNPEAVDYVNDFQHVSPEQRERINAARNA